MKYCTTPRCPNKVKAGRCEDCRRTYERDYRGSRHARGYDTRWTRLRAWFLQQPENSLCADCKPRGLYVLATDVDHVIPFRGLDDPLRLAVNNLRGLCRPCHAAKHSRGA